MFELLSFLILAPAVTFASNGSMEATIGVDTVPDIVSQQVGYMSDGSIALDSNTPSGSLYKAGIRLNTFGAMFATTTTSVTDVYVQGVRVSTSGQVVYASGAPANFTNRNPVTSTGALAVTLSFSSVSFDNTLITFDSTTVTWDQT